MTENLPARQDHGELVVDTVHDMHPDHHDPQHQEVQQNVGVALVTGRRDHARRGFPTEPTSD